MGKTYIDTVKYIVYANVEINGLVEKPDVVGAIFGQTEGLLGDELDLRELQKNGRIGRIEVDLVPKGGRSTGMIKLPSSLDMVETCILGAALESVDRVGPCDAKIGVDKVEDTRSVKRKQLVERAKSLLKSLIVEELPESKEITEMVRAEVKTAEISAYGPEKLPCGPKIETYDSIIIVEGRADVLNMLKNNIANVIACGGANAPRSLIEFTKKKEITLFLDGDRGGDIILSGLAEEGEIDFVARAPPGTEVEELSRKELIKSLRAKIPFEQVMKGRQDKLEFENREREREHRDFRENREPREERQPYQRLPYQQREGRDERGRQDMRRGGNRGDRGAAMRRMPASPPPRISVPSPIPFPEKRELEVDMGAPVPQAAEPVSKEPDKVPDELVKSLGELENTLRARFYDKGMALVKEIPVRDMIKALEEEGEVGAVVFDGIITQRLADLVKTKGGSALVGIRQGNVSRKPPGLAVYTKS